jgi:hypothetical protein
MQSVFQRQSASPANFDVIGFLPNHFATRDNRQCARLR